MAKTSTQILDERNALEARVEELERALKIIDDEIEHALRMPDIHFLAMCRIGAVVRRARLARCEEPPVSGVRVAS